MVKWGGCPFALLFYLNNVEDTLIVPPFLWKPPKLKWVSKDEGGVIVQMNEVKNGDLPEEYTCKYTTKGVPKRGMKGDVLLACIPNLNPLTLSPWVIFQKPIIM